METNPVKPDASGMLRDFCAMLLVFLAVGGLGVLIARATAPSMVIDLTDMGVDVIDAADGALGVHAMPPDDDFDTRHCLRTHENWP